MPPLNTTQRSTLSLAIASALLTPVANAATITVNSISDAQNAAGCTLREAIQVSNTNNLGNTGCQISNGALNNSDEIVFNLAGDNNTILLSGNQLEVTQTVSITGPGAEQLTIDANGQSRVLLLQGGENNATANTNIRALTLTGGNSDYADDFIRLDYGDVGYETLADGGAISISNSPNSIISDVLITDSVANDGDGGGISIESSDGLAINNTTVSGNSTIDPEIRFSGYRYNRGGGIFISNSNAVSINTSEVNKNMSTLVGGGINLYNSDNVSINNSTISKNTAVVSSGGGISVQAPYSSSSASDNAVINSSTINNNVALNISQLGFSTLGGTGGGIYFGRNANGTVVNSTISGNSSDREGGGIGTSGRSNSSLVLLASTVINNTAPPVNRSSRFGGGIFGNVELSGNNVIANNVGGDCSREAVSSGVNWIGDNNCLEIPTPILSGDPQLGPLQDNGGATFTHAPLPNSSLINASTDCSSPIVNGLDQRGEPRGTDTCFIGSVEGIQENTINFNIIPLSNNKTVVFPL